MLPACFRIPGTAVLPPGVPELHRGKNSFEQLFVGAPCFSLMFWDCDSGAFFCLLWISRLFRFIKQTQLTFDVFAFFTGSAEKLFRQVIDLFHQVFVILTQIFHSFLQGTVEFCLCCEQCIQLGYGILVFQEFDLCRAACHHPCSFVFWSYFNIKPVRKEAENPVVPAGFQISPAVGTLLAVQSPAQTSAS